MGDLGIAMKFRYIDESYMDNILCENNGVSLLGSVKLLSLFY